VSAGIQRMPSTGARIGRLIATVLVFLVLGPPLGAVICVALVAGIGMHWDIDWDVGGHNWLALLGLIYVVPASYFVGAAPAIAAGFAIGVKQSFFGRARWPLALGIGLIVAVAVLNRSGQVPDAGTQDAFPEFSAALILACLIATMLCWALVRNWYYASPTATELTP
jgi:hypothetical protein